MNTKELSIYNKNLTINKKIKQLSIKFSANHLCNGRSPGELKSNINSIQCRVLPVLIIDFHDTCIAMKYCTRVQLADSNF